MYSARSCVSVALRHQWRSSIRRSSSRDARRLRAHSVGTSLRARSVEFPISRMEDTGAIFLTNPHYVHLVLSHREFQCPSRPSICRWRLPVVNLADLQRRNSRNGTCSAAQGATKHTRRKDMFYRGHLPLASGTGDISIQSLIRIHH